MRTVVINHVTLDGVMQGPGRPEEDTRDGFTLGGWAEPNTDEVLNQAWGARLSASSGFLFGRRTYEDVLGHWNAQGGPFRDALNDAQKYVVSMTLREPLPWPNSTLLSDDVAERVAELRAVPGADLHIMGSGELIQSLGRLNLVDEYVLSIHPLVLGSGRRLFSDGFPLSTLRLVDVTPSSTGVLIATYRRG
jgi:dihydrofolate reductase